MLRTLWTIAVAVPSFLCAQEVCNNGIDDDNNGLVDLNDPACPCATSIQPDGLQSYIRNHSFEDRMCCPYGFVSIVSPPWLSCASGWQQATTATSDYFNECGYAPAGMPLPPPDGDGAVGFFAMPGYFEYVGTCLTYPEPANPLLAGTTYTLSLWISTAAVNDTHSQPQSHADPSYFTEQLPLALFGRANECQEFPIGTMDCIGYQPGWQELGRVMVQPAWEWTQVSITFTPAQDIHTVMIGGGCDVPGSFAGMTITNPQGDTYAATPYFLVDDLMLTISTDQVLLPTGNDGSICAGDATVHGTPPAGATGYQWYHNGVAVVGQTGPTMNVAQPGLGGGTYTLASAFNGECLMGSTYVPPAIGPIPRPALEPGSGCAPLSVAFADTSSGSFTVQWELGDGGLSADSAFTHIYTAPGSYDVRLSVQNAAGCISDILIEDAVVVHPGVGAVIAATPNPTDTEHTDVQLSASGSSEAIVSWWWDLGDAVPANSVAGSLTATFPSEPGSYPVLLAVADAQGCVDTVRSMVVVVENGDVEMPNVFTPNGDGDNDRFVPLNLTLAAGLLEIFNRWGQLLYSTSSLSTGWDGKVSGDPVPPGTYYYVVTPRESMLAGQASTVRTGHVTLLR